MQPPKQLPVQLTPPPPFAACQEFGARARTPTRCLTYPSASLLLSPLCGSTTIWEMKGGGNYFPETCYAAHDFELQWFARRPQLLALPTRSHSPGTALGNRTPCQLWPPGEAGGREKSPGTTSPPSPVGAPGSGSGGGGRSGRRERFRRPPHGSPLAGVRRLPAELLVGTGWWGTCGCSPSSPAASRHPVSWARPLFSDPGGGYRLVCPGLTRSPPPPPPPAGGVPAGACLEESAAARPLARSCSCLRTAPVAAGR